jgi:hypothetical protein
MQCLATNKPLDAACDNHLPTMEGMKKMTMRRKVENSEVLHHSLHAILVVNHQFASMQQTQIQHEN